jgi:GSCFA family
MHPYRTQPVTAFWAKVVSQNWDPSSLSKGRALLKATDQIASLGSCFAANLAPYLRANGLRYVQEEQRHPLLTEASPENMSYDKFSAAYGNIYTVRQFRQLLDRATGEFWPKEDRWVADSEIIDPFRPGLRYRARSHREFDALTAQHLASVRKVFEKSNVVIFTLGLTEAWISKEDGAVFPACPGTVAGNFNSDAHAFHNFSVSEIVSDLDSVRTKLKSLRQDVRLILTVSPVPLVATATQDHVLIASTHSKSSLRAACGEFQHHPDVLTFRRMRSSLVHRRQAIFSRWTNEM